MLVEQRATVSPVVEAVEGGGGAGGGEHQVHGAARGSGPAAVTSQTWTRIQLRILGGYKLCVPPCSPQFVKNVV